MSKIDIFALGGLGEDGKNMFVIDIDEKIFILDAGLKYPTDELYGVDAIMPDFSYLKKHKKRIQGLFLSHGHEDHIGAIPKLLLEFEVPIYGTYFTLALLKDTLKENNMNTEAYTFHTIKKDSVLSFGKIKVSFYQTTHSIPESIGIALDTEDGVIVYAPDYTFNQNVEPPYQTSFERLAAIASKQVLALLSESIGSEYDPRYETIKELDHHLNQAFLKAKGRRVVATCFSTDIYRIQTLINVALKHQRDIAIIGRKAQRMVDIAVNLGVLKIPQDKLRTLKFIDQNNKNTLKDSMVLVTGERHEPFYMLQRMVKKQDRLIHLNEEDDVIMMTPPVPGTEKISARALDILYRHDINVLKIDKTMLPSAHASSEDVKLLTNILNPKYFIPIIGEYRHLYTMRNIAKSIGYKESEIKVLENGEVLRIENKEDKGIVNKIKSADILIDGILEGDLSEVVLKDREILSQDGVLLIIGHIDARKKEMISEAEIISRGFVYMKENAELMDDVQEIYETITTEVFRKKYVDWRFYKDRLREEVSKFLFHETKRRPIVIPVLIDVQP